MHPPRSLLFLPVLACPIAAVEKSWPVSNLTLELSHFVPACAEDCFTSFLQANYGLERGREKIPSLQELCSTDGETGFTVGEGAVQCIAAEKSIDGCSDTDASSSVIYNAHQMCTDQPGAITPTHGVITATLLLPPSGAGPVSFPAPSRTTRTRSMSRTTGRPSTLVVDTHSLTRTTSSASSTTDTTLGASVSTGTRPAAETSTTAAAAAAAAAGAARAAGSGGSLTPLQKAGISVGVIGFAIIGIGILLLFRLRRAKRKREHKRLPETPSRRDSWGYKFDRNHGGGHTGGDAAWMANSVHPCRGPSGASSIPPVISAARTTTVTPSAASTATLSTAGPPAGPSTTSTSSSAAPPRAYNRASWRPSAIGLAISPAASKNALPRPNSRPISKLLPARPLLTLAIPKKPSTPPIKYAEMPSYRNQSETSSPKCTRVASHPPVLPKLSIVPERHDDSLSVTKTTNKPRESTMTEFEEDGRESSSMSPQGQIWRPPRPPSAVPLSAAAYYVADKHGNWVLEDARRISQTAELEGTTPLTAHPKLATSMTILPISNNQQKTDQPQSSSNNNAPQPGVTSHAVSHVAFHRPGARRSSSVPNPPAPAQQRIRVVTEPPLKLQDAQDDFVPRPLFSSARRSSGRSLTRPRAPSADSGITTMTTTSSEDEEDEKDGEPPPNVQQINLPPVAESPRNGNAHAHAHASANGHGHGHGHGHGRSPVSYPKIPGRETGPTGTRAKLVPPRMPTTTVKWPPSSPSLAGNTMRLVKPSPEPEPEDDDDDDDRTQLPSASVPSQRPRSQLQQPSPFPARQQTWQSPRPRRPLSPSWIPGLPAHPHPQRRPQHTNTGPGTGPGTGTSTLWLPPQARARAGTLKMETEPDHERPHLFRPILSISTDWHTGSAPQPRGLPSSPPWWVPTLTPTRRGTDLYLNVR